MPNEMYTIAGNLVSRSQGLRQRYQAELDKLGAKARYELALEVARLTQEQNEKIAFAAQVQKEVIEVWTDEDYVEMEVNRNTADTELGFTTTILPLANIHMESERRKASSKDRVEATWGQEWENLLGGLMPPWPAEEFLRELAVFSENHTEWEAAKLILEDRIKERRAAPKTKKVTWLMSRDIAKRTTMTKRKLRGRKSDAGQLCSEQAPSFSSTEDVAAQGSVETGGSTVEEPTNSDAGSLPAQGSVETGGSTVEEPAGAGPSSAVDKGKGKETVAGPTTSDVGCLPAQGSV